MVVLQVLKKKDPGPDSVLTAQRLSGSSSAAGPRLPRGGRRTVRLNVSV